MQLRRLFVWSFAVGGAFAQSVAITEAIVYPSASAPPLRRATVLIEGNRIEAVGERVRVPSGTEVIRCTGCVVVAGFWNSHVHLTEAKWEGAATQPSDKLGEQIQSMLTGSGFTTVVDTASVLSNTVALRGRIENGDVLGPRILTAGTPIYPPDGVPYYVKDALPAQALLEMIPPRSPDEATAIVDRNIRGGADIVKLFTGSWVSRSQVLPMPEEIAAAAVQAAHRNGRLVFAHPSNLAGIRVALASGVDVLAHAPDDTRGVDRAILKTAVDRGMAMIPTLKLFSESSNISDIRRVVRQFHELGGTLVFGTDTGYLADYDVSQEFDQLGKAGLTWRDVLRMLTENPARLFKDQENRGRIAPGMIADLTVLGSDPASDGSAFSHVRFTIRNGRMVWKFK